MGALRRCAARHGGVNGAYLVEEPYADGLAEHCQKSLGTGERVYRFQTPRLLQPGDEFIPLLTLQDARGDEVVAASVLKFNSDFKGAIVLSGDKTRGQAASNLDLHFP